MNIFDLQATISLNGDSFMNGVQQAQSAFSGLGSSVGAGAVAVGTMVGNMATKAASGLLDLGKESVQTGMNFDAAMSNVAAISGATGEEFDSLRDKAKEMGASTKFTATEAAEAFSYMAMAGWDASSMLSGIEGIMNLAAASGESLATTSDIVTDALTAFGLSAEDSGHFADVLAAASSAANTNVSMMGETFKYVAPLAGTMGYSVEDMATAIGTMANSGIKGSQAGTALRSAITRLVKPTKDVTTAMEALGIKGGAITNADGSMKSFSETVDVLRNAFDGLSEADQAMYAGMIFGQEAMSGMLAIINASEADYNKLADTIGAASDAMGGMGTAAEMAQTQLDNLQGDVTIFQSAFDGLKTAIYDKVKGPLREMAQTASEAMSQLADAVNNGGISEAFSAIGEMIGGFVTDKFTELTGQLGPFGEVLQTVAGAVTEFAAGMRDVAADKITQIADAVRGFAEGFDASSAVSVLGEIGGAVSGLASAFAGASAEVIEGVSSAVKGFLEGFSESDAVEKIKLVGENAASLLGAFLTTTGEVIGGIASSVKEFLDAFGQSSAGEIIGDIAGYAADLLSAFLIAGETVIQGVASGIKKFLDAFDESGAVDAIESVAGVIADLFAPFSAALGEWVQKAADGLADVSEHVGELAGNLANGIVDDIKDLADNFEKWAPWVAAVATGLVTMKIAGAVATGITLLKSALEGATLSTKLMAAAQQALNAVMNFAGGPIGIVIGLIAALAAGLAIAWNTNEDFRNSVISLWNSCVDGAKKAAEAIGKFFTEWIPEKFSDMLDWFKDLPQKFMDIGRNIVDGIKQGFTEKWNEFKSWVGDLTSGITGFVKGIFGEHSPSKVFAEIGFNLVAGMEVGWGSEWGKFEKQVGRDLDGLTDTAKMKFADSAIGRSSAAGISSNMALYGQRGGDAVEINLVLDGDVAARALYDPLRRAEAQKGMRKEAAYA